jgi:hypothetical protein
VLLATCFIISTIQEQHHLPCTIRIFSFPAHNHPSVRQLEWTDVQFTNPTQQKNISILIISA